MGLSSRTPGMSSFLEKHSTKAKPDILLLITKHVVDEDLLKLQKILDNISVTPAPGVINEDEARRVTSFYQLVLLSIMCDCILYQKRDIIEGMFEEFKMWDNDDKPVESKELPSDSYYLGRIDAPIGGTKGKLVNSSGIMKGYTNQGCIYQYLARYGNEYIDLFIENGFTNMNGLLEELCEQQSHVFWKYYDDNYRNKALKWSCDHHNIPTFKKLFPLSTVSKEELSYFSFKGGVFTIILEDHGMTTVFIDTMEDDESISISEYEGNHLYLDRIDLVADFKKREENYSEYMDHKIIIDNIGREWSYYDNPDEAAALVRTHRMPLYYKGERLESTEKVRSILRNKIRKSL